MFHIKQNIMLAFSHILSVSDVNFDAKTIRLHWLGSFADFRSDSISDASECASMLVTSYDVEDVTICSAWTDVNGVSSELTMRPIELSDDTILSVFFEVKFS